MEPTSLAADLTRERGAGVLEPRMPRARWRQVPESSTVSIADHVVRLRLDGNHGVIDLSAGRATEATPRGVCDAAAAAMAQGDTHQTPARGTAQYNRAVAEKMRTRNGLEVDPDRHTIATLGCKNGLTLALMALLHPGDEVIIEDPCFVSYSPTIRMCGGVPVPVALCAETGFQWRLEELVARITARTKALIICNPHNPTGAVASREYLQAIADIACEHDLFVISDEVYELMAWGDRTHVSIASLPGMLDRTVTLMGFTKSHSMGGWRIGYAAANQGVAATMARVQQHLMTCASSIGQAAAIYAMSPEGMAEVRPMWARWESNCERVASRINGIPGVSCHAPEGAFYAWVNIRETAMGSVAFCDRLLSETHVAAVPGVAFGEASEGFIRITCVKSSAEMDEAAERIDSFVKSL